EIVDRRGARAHRAATLNGIAAGGVCGRPRRLFTGRVSLPVAQRMACAYGFSGAVRSDAGLARLFVCRGSVGGGGHFVWPGAGLAAGEERVKRNAKRRSGNSDVPAAVSSCVPGLVDWNGNRFVFCFGIWRGAFAASIATCIGNAARI